MIFFGREKQKAAKRFSSNFALQSCGAFCFSAQRRLLSPKRWWKIMHRGLGDSQKRQAEWLLK